MSTNSDELFGRLVEIWNNIDALTAVLSMRRRLTSRKDIDDDHTKYYYETFFVLIELLLCTK